MSRKYGTTLTNLLILDILPTLDYLRICRNCFSLPHVKFAARAGGEGVEKRLKLLVNSVYFCTERYDDLTKLT